MQKVLVIIEIAEEKETFKSGVYFSLFDSFARGTLTIGGGFSRSTVQAFVETPPRVPKSGPSTRSYRRNRTWTSTSCTGALRRHPYLT